MNWADITIVGIILISAVISLFRGFVREVMSLLAWAAAFWAAATFAPAVAERLEPYVAVPPARFVAAFVGVLIGVLLLAGIVNYVVGRLVDSTGLTSTDRALGAIFGVLRGAAIVAIAVLLAGLTRFPGAPWWQQSRAIPPFQSAAQLAVSWMPPDIGKHFSY